MKLNVIILLLLIPSDTHTSQTKSSNTLGSHDHDLAMRLTDELHSYDAFAMAIVSNEDVVEL